MRKQVVTSADVARAIEGTTWEATTPTATLFYEDRGTHKYEVKAVITPMLRDYEKRERKTLTYYVRSISQLMHYLNRSDYIQKVSSDEYNTIKGTYVTNHRITRIY